MRMSNDHPSPFWGKMKPIPHYFEQGVIRFSVREGQLYYSCKAITRTFTGIITNNQLVPSKEYLDKLLAVKSIHEIPSIEVVN